MLEEHLCGSKYRTINHQDSFLLTQGMGIYSQPVSKATICKLGQDRISHFVATVDISSDLFLPIIKDGKLKPATKITLL